MSFSPVGWKRSARSDSSGVGSLTPVVAGFSASSFPLVLVSFDPLEEYGGTSVGGRLLLSAIRHGCSFILIFSRPK